MDKLNEAFKILRKSGFIAKQNFQCCNSCAGYAIASHVNDKITKKQEYKRKIRGAVFYNRQDTARMKKYGKLYINYGPIGTTGHGVVGETYEAIGSAITTVLTACNLKWEWSGNPDERILVIDPGE